MELTELETEKDYDHFTTMPFEKSVTYLPHPKQDIGKIAGKSGNFSLCR